MNIYVSKLAIIGSDNGLLPGQHQAIIWPNAGILLIEPLGINYNEILIEIHSFSFKKMHFNMSSEKMHPFCLCLNVLNAVGLEMLIKVITVTHFIIIHLKSKQQCRGISELINSLRTSDTYEAVN